MRSCCCEERDVIVAEGLLIDAAPDPIVADILAGLVKYDP
jgi:hypothetical protein